MNNMNFKNINSVSCRNIQNCHKIIKKEVLKIKLPFLLLVVTKSEY